MYAPRSILALVSSVLLLAANTRAQEGQSVPLGYGVSDDASYYVHGLTSETPDPGMLAFERALGKLVASGIHEDLFNLATIEMSAEQRQRAKATFDHMIDLCGLVDWSLLGEREIVFAYKMAMPMPEYVMLARVPEDQIKAQVAGANKLLAEFAGMIGSEMSSLREIELESGQLQALEINGAPMQMTVGSIGDVLIFSSSSRMAVAAVNMLGRGDGRGSLVQTERYRSALEQLPKATEATIYIDVGGIFEFLNQALLIGKASAGNGNSQQAEMLNLMTAIFTEMDVCRQILITSASDGQSMTSAALFEMQPGYEDSKFAQLFANQQPWMGWTRYVPADASEFYFDSGLNFSGLCDMGIQIAKDNLREPAIPVMVMTQMRDQFLSNLSGESAYVMLPAMADGCPLGEMLAFWRLENSEGVLRGTERMLEGVADLLAQRGQEMDFVAGEDSLELVLPAFPWIRPTLAIRDGCMVIATSPAALAKVDRVFAGEEASIRSREDFAELGIGNGKDASYLGYGHMDSGMEGLANLASAAGFFMSLMPEQKDTLVAIKMGAVLTKLAPALREMQMSFDWGTEILPSEQPNQIMSRTVYRYR